MNHFHYTKSEKKVIRRIEEVLRTKKASVFCIDDILSAIPTKTDPQVQKVNVLAKLRSIMIKSAANLGNPAIIKTSRLGRGAKSVYEVTVMFDDLVASVEA